MKHNYLILLLLISGLTLPNLNAQIWNQFGPFVDIFDTDQQDFFQDQLDNLEDSLLHDRYDGLTLDSLNLAPAVDSLFFYMDGDLIGNADSSQLVWDLNHDLLDSISIFTNLNTQDSVSLDSQFIDINNIWNGEVDSLNTIIGSYQDSLSGIDLNALHQGEVRYDIFSGVWVQSYLNLEQGNHDFLNTHEDQDIDSLSQVLDTSLFSDMFDIEMAFGQGWNQVEFWGDHYSVRSSVIRIASVPDFSQNMAVRWSVEGSFFNNPDDIRDETSAALNDQLNALTYNANFAFLYLPHFGSISRGEAEFRLYTSIGLDIKSYAPSHIDAQYPERVGQTTGFGPEIGAGFVVNFANMSMYGYGTIAHGEIEATDIWPEYRYNSKTLNTGIRYGDLLNIRYSMGKSSWATTDRKNARFSQFTVGILLDALRN